MKSVKDFVIDDMWNHNLMSGDEIRGCVNGKVHKTAEEKNKYCQGIFATFPHMLLGNFSRWMWEEAPNDYNAFMEASLKPLQDVVFPELDKYFNGGLSESEKAEIIVHLLTEVIPQHILTGYYKHMFAGQEGYKDIADFWAQVKPLLGMTAALIRASADMPVEEKEEVFLYLGARYPFLLVKRWYDWQFGKDKLEMPGPPPGGGGPGGPGGPPPGGPGGPPPGGPPPHN